jgi:hypothetical protein
MEAELVSTLERVAAGERVVDRELVDSWPAAAGLLQECRRMCFGPRERGDKPGVAERVATANPSQVTNPNGGK